MAKPEETGSEIILLSIADKDKLCKFSKDVEGYLGVKLVQSLLCLNGFRVPQASAILCAKLAAWREQVELICSRQSAIANRHLMLPKIPRAGGELKTMQNVILASAPVGSALTPEPERTDWKPFISSCEELVRGLRQFSVALEHLGKYYNLHTTEIVNRMGAFTVTLKEIQAIGAPNTQSFEEDGGGYALEEDHYLDVICFTSDRLKVCGLHLVRLTKAFKDYCDHDVMHIRDNQKQAFEDLASVTQVSTFFAGVVATTLQFSLSITGQTRAVVAINTLWLSSLVLGISSAFNSLLSVTMQKVVSTIPLNAQPVYVRFWVQQSHIALLAVGVALYVLGLGIYVVETQRVVAAVIPCVLAGVWGFTVVISVVSWENVRSWLANWRPQKKDHAGKRNEAEKRIMEIVIDKGRDEISLDSITPPNEDDERTSVVDADTLVEEEQDASNYDTKLIDEYVARLSVKFFKDRFESGTFPAFTRGKIQHFRCSPNGKWLVACHEFACLVYDVEHDFAYQILTSNGGARPSAEHAEWSPTGEYLLLRSNKELWLWKTPSRNGKDIFKSVETNFKLRKGTFRYIKWVNNNDFLLLMDETELFIINRKTGLKQANKFMLSDGFTVRQVFPLDPRLESILCLVRQSVVVDGCSSNGVDHIFIFSKGTSPNVFSKLTHSGSSYKRVQTKLLHTNVKNLKMDKSKRHIIVNYELENVEDKVKHFAVDNSGMPELWHIRDDEGEVYIHASARDESMGVITKTPESKDVKLINLGEASFAGPAQRIVMFHCDDRVHFYRYDESKDSIRLKWFKWFNFELKNRGFVKPILTWGETYTQPVCFATNVDGDGRIFYSSYQENLSIEASADQPASVVKDTDAVEGAGDVKVKTDIEYEDEHPSAHDTNRPTQEIRSGQLRHASLRFHVALVDNL